MNFNPVSIQRWAPPNSWFGRPWEGWYVGVSRTRDSDLITESNWGVFNELVGNASDHVEVDDSVNEPGALIDSVQIVHERHWACGWIEWVAIHESDVAALEEADALLTSLADYPVINDEDLCNREDAEYETWFTREFAPRIERYIERQVLWRADSWNPDWPSLDATLRFLVEPEKDGYIQQGVSNADDGSGISSQRYRFRDNEYWLDDEEEAVTYWQWIVRAYALHNRQIEEVSDAAQS